MGRRDIVDVVIRDLDDLRISANAGRQAWSKKVKTALCKAGKRCGFRVYASGVSEKRCDGGEWLYDVTWLEYEGRLLAAAPLVAECEWGRWERGSIQNDFQKLLLARAGVRLMIFDAEQTPGVLEAVEYMAEQVWDFRESSDDDIWLLAAREWTNDSWLFRWFVIEGDEMHGIVSNER